MTGMRMYAAPKEIATIALVSGAQGMKRQRAMNE
jgi:hypothetical protein